MKITRLFVLFFIFLVPPLSTVAQHLQLADSLHQHGMTFYKKGSYNQAEFYLKQAYQLYKKYGNTQDRLQPGLDYAEILMDRSKYDPAQELLKTLEQTALTQHNIHAQARIENDLALIFKQSGRNKRALHHFKKAILLAEEVQDTLRLGYINNNIGSMYFSQGNYKLALQYREKSLDFLKEMNGQRDISIVLNNIALTYKKLSLYNQALEYYMQSLAIRKKLGAIDLLATIYGNIAVLYKQLGNLNKALSYYQKGLTYSKRVGNPDQQATTLNNIGTLYYKLGQPERALEYYRQSMKLKKKFASPSSLATTYNNIAERLWDMGQYEESINYTQQALALKRKTGSTNGVAYSLLDLARKRMAQGQDQQASELAERAASLAHATQDITLRSQIELVRGSIYLKSSSLTDALACFKKAYDISQKLPPSAQLVPLQKMAVTYHKMGSEKALEFGNKVIAIIEDERSKVGAVQALKTNYFKKYSNFYIQLASWSIAYHGTSSKAYHLIEAAKARSLNDELTRAAQHINENLPEKEQLKRAEKITAINKLYTTLHQTESLDRQAQIKKKIRTKELQYASYENKLHTRYPRFKLLHKPTLATLKQVQEICDDHTAILEYAVAKKTLIIFLITADSIKARHFELASSKLRTEIKQFRKAILARAPKDSLAANSKNIYRQLIQPFESQLSAYKNLMIIPDGPITYLPFEALIHHNRYLVRKFTIKYAPSATSFLLIPPSRKETPKNLLAIANATGTSSQYKAPALPSTDIEIDSIATYFQHVTTLKDQAVNEHAVKTALQKKHSFIHIAAHSIIDEQNPSLSGIILASTKNELGIGEDGFLNSSEIYRLNIEADMVVLSACESGMGPLVNGEGMLGLQRAFFVAGTSTVVVSLWNVYDRSTARLMQEFYKPFMHPSYAKKLRQYWASFLRWTGWDDSLPFGDKASAMRQAKLAMLQNPVYKDPVYWAPFIVVGR